MPSQTDIDQGGTVREWANVYLGPSAGWVRYPLRNFLASPNSPTNLNAAGTYTLDISTTLVQVVVSVGAVTIILPSALASSLSSPITQPGLAVRAPVTIIDIGGFAQANPITIKPASIAETIMGLTQIQITTNYGGFILQPNSRTPGWTNAQ